MKFKINSLRVKNYNFIGELNPYETPLDLLNALKVLPNQYETAHIEIYGEFGVSVSHDEAEVDEIYSIIASHNGIDVDITDDSRIDTQAIVDDITSQFDAGELHQDYLDAMGDSRYDAWKDSQFDTE